MSDNTIHNNNNKVFQNAQMAERQSSMSTTLNNNNNNNINDTTQANNNINNQQSPALNKQNNNQHQHFVNIPLPPNTNNNINILQQLNLPPIPPPAAFQPSITTPSTTIPPTALPNLNMNMIPGLPNQLNLNQLNPIQPKLNATAPVFTPNPFANIPLPSTPNDIAASTNLGPAGSVQGYVAGQQIQNPLSNQIQTIKQKIQESLGKLQILSLQLNALNMINQQNQTIQSLQQYQSVYQQYQLEFTNTLLLNQYLQNLNNISCLQTGNNTQNTAQQQQQQTPQGPVATAQQLLNDDQNNNIKKSGINQLETIEEGEEEEMEDDQVTEKVAAISTESVGIGAGCISPMDDMEGTADYGLLNKKVDEALLRYSDCNKKNDHNDVGEQLQKQANQLWKHRDLLYGDTETDTMKQGEKQRKKKGNSELEKIKKQIRGILNKITPENFDKLSQDIASILKVADIAVQNKQFQTLSDEQLRVAQKAQFKALIKLILKCILEKAINEPLFSNQYARLCYSLYLYAEQNELKKKLFRQQLLSLCHSVFKKARNGGESDRFIGIITMIGELFTYGLISWNVISSGIFEELLPPQQALDIEAICKLLKTSGHNFDRHHYKEVNIVINNLSKYSQNYDFRTQCLVKEIYEMRKNDWKQRKDIKKESPKTLNQIHKEFNLENKNKKTSYNQPQYNQQQSTYRPQRNDNNNNNNYYRPQRNNNGYNSGYSHYNNNNNNNHNGYQSRGYQSRGGNNGRWRNHHNHHGSRYNNGGYNNSNSSRRKSKNLRPTVEFVKDVTLPDRSHYPANKVLTKTWAMRNSGELSWGDNVELVYFKGDETLSLEGRYPVIDAQPGQEVEISATIKTPTNPGRYCTYFRLQKNGKFFGPRVWVDIIVSSQQSPKSMDGRLNCATSKEIHSNKQISCQ